MATEASANADVACHIYTGTLAPSFCRGCANGALRRGVRLRAVRCAAATQRVYRNHADTYNRNGDRRTLGFRDSGLWAAAGSEAQAAAGTFNLLFGHATCLSNPTPCAEFSPLVPE